jgi:hypothetical protein
LSQEENRQEAILKTRAENQKLAERVELGTAYHEPVEVYYTDKSKHRVEVHALSDGELIAACEKAGSSPADLQKPEKMIGNMQLVAAIAEIATRDPDLRNKLLANEGAKIALKAFELMKPPKD